jgi:hypothetical protein
MHGCGSLKKATQLFTHSDYRKSHGCWGGGADINGVILKTDFENHKFRAFGYLRRAATILYIHFNTHDVKRFVITLLPP